MSAAALARRRSLITMPTLSTTRSQLDRGLAIIRDDVLRLGSQVESHIEWSVHALRGHDLGLARRVVDGDARIGSLRFKIETECLDCLATQQPTARDLRSLLAAMHMAGELERMADHAKGVAGISFRSHEMPESVSMTTLVRMQVAACKMLHLSMDAYVREDEALARMAADQDVGIDELYLLAVSQALDEARTHNGWLELATYCVWTAHNLERIGDRVTNVCERVLFLVTGELGDYAPNQPIRA